jgi:putative ABC transport system substrate-binding protein
MDRRAFIGSFGFWILAMPRVAIAQSARKVYRIGIISVGSTTSLAGSKPQSASAIAFLRAMGELGYIYGQHFVTESRGTEGKPERATILAAELVTLQLDVIVASGPTLVALKQATTTIPIVMAAASDPVGSGYVQSLGHPGSNFTGLSLQATETTGKRLELLKEISPGAAPVAVIWSKSGIADWSAAEAAARQRGWKLLPLEIRDVDELERTLRAAVEARAGAILVFAASILFPHAQRVADLVARCRLPAIYDLRPYVEAGGLMSYGPNIVDIWRRSAVYVDKILKGANPADLPIEQPTKFELVINAKTARTLSLTIPQSLLLRADEVIQ